MLSCERTGSCSFKWHFSNLIPSHKRRARRASCEMRHAKGPSHSAKPVGQILPTGLSRACYALEFLQSPFFLDNILFFLREILFFLGWTKNLEVLILYFKQF
jgi:hypothetical protein